jgi:Methyltransferase domain
MKFFTPSQLDLFLRTPGAMSIFEALALRNMMGIVPDVGICAECGTHAGKSSIAIASGFGDGPTRLLHLVDPLFDPGVGEKGEWAYARLSDFAPSVLDRVHQCTSNVGAKTWAWTSLDALPLVQDFVRKKGAGAENRFAFVFLDSGDHEYALVRAEADFLRDKMVTGGILALHDFGNYSGPVRVWAELQREGFENVPIPWDEIKACIWANAPDAEKTNNSWHKQEDPEPCFLAAVRKV